MTAAWLVPMTAARLLQMTAAPIPSLTSSPKGRKGSDNYLTIFFTVETSSAAPND